MNDFSKIFTTASLKALDEYTIENEPIAPVELMERAAGRFTDTLLDIFSDTVNFNVFCGSGNNGGDGYVIARLLQSAGKRVVVYALPATQGSSGEWRENQERWSQMGGVTFLWEKDMAVVWEEKGVVVDALFGAGLNRPLTGVPAEMIGCINSSGWPVVAVDMPSGLLGEDNRANGGARVEANYTFTFQFPKLALLLPENERYVGELRVLDIGLHPRILREMPSNYYYLSQDAIVGRLPRWSKFAHKGTLGHVLLIAGSEAMMGAAMLATEGALRSGAGLVTAHVPAVAKLPLHLYAPEALVEADPDEACFTGTGELDRYAAIGVGPGLGIRPPTVRALRKLLEQWRGRMVLDADALNILAAEPELLELLPEGAVLTPHSKEFERLAGKSQNDFDRLNKLTNFAQAHRVHIVLKGAHTTIATPEGECFFNMTGNPGMGKGGSGDVLTGMITALLGNSLPVVDAVTVAVYVHGLAGDLAAGEWGQRGMKSGDIAKKLGEAWRQLQKDSYKC